MLKNTECGCGKVFSVPKVKIFYRKKYRSIYSTFLSTQAGILPHSYGR
jgi:hypothetical protein